MSVDLRDYQNNGVTEIKKNLKRGDSVICYQGPTGSGKTRIFTHITEGASKKGNIVWIVVHRKELLLQASESLGAFGVQHGMISPMYTPDYWSKVQIASIDTLKNKYALYPVPQIIICDEFHHSVSPTWAKVLGYFIARGTKILGFSATPNRLDGRGLGKAYGGLCDSLVLGPQPQDLIDRGYLAGPRIFRPTLASPEGLHQKFGEFKRDEVDALMDKPSIIGDAVEQYTKICPNLPTISFVPSLKMAEHVQNQYRAAGYQAAMVDGSMHNNERKGRLLALGNGGLHVLISCQLIDEGVDVPIVEGIQMLNPTKSLGRFLQQSGRGARMFKGKECYFLLDHVCNTFRQDMAPNHGDPAWDRDWSLEGNVQGRKNKQDDEKNIAVRQCSECFAVFTPSPKCPYCGFVRELSPREIEIAEGQLEEIDTKRLQQIEADRAKMFARREEGKCSSLADFQELAKQRGYAPGWAFHRHRAREQRQGARA